MVMLLVVCRLNVVFDLTGRCRTHGLQWVGGVAIPCRKSRSLQRGSNLKIRYLLIKRILGQLLVTIDPQYPLKGQGV